MATHNTAVLERPSQADESADRLDSSEAINAGDGLFAGLLQCITIPASITLWGS